MRAIPATMATQHPDNARAPYWERDGDGFVSVAEELNECLSSFRELKVHEFMWDWEGKYADEAVVDRLFAEHFAEARRLNFGRDHFLTFRLPNIWRERGYSLLRALMVILTSEDFARDLKLHSPPLFEVILPMVERADQLTYVQRIFRELARLKQKVVNHRRATHNDCLELIPLVEGVEQQLDIHTLLIRYRALYRQMFGRPLPYLRPFLARSDPALVSGLLATVLANKVALAEIARFSKESGVPTFPIIGAGSLVFRGGLSPDTLDTFLNQYQGVRTVTIQSAFRYDYPLPAVKRAVNLLNQRLATAAPAEIVPGRERQALGRLVRQASLAYQRTLRGLLPTLTPWFKAVPARRERRLHIGLLAYGRSLGRRRLPRAINFTATCYTLGVPPEFFGLGEWLAGCSRAGRALVERYYPTLASDLERAGRFLNWHSLNRLGKRYSAWSRLEGNIRQAEKKLGLQLGPRTTTEALHANLTSNALLVGRRPQALATLMVETGKLRRSLG